MQPPARAMSVTDTLRSLVQRGEVHLPAVPDVTRRLQELLADEDRADARRAAEIIATEPAIATSVLRLANSVVYGGLKQVLELAEAVGRIGMRQVSSLATTIAIRGVFESKSPERQLQLADSWSLALCAAVTTRKLCVGLTDPEHAYLAGLLHDIGKPLILKLLDQVEKKLLEPLTPAAVVELLDALHTELGHKLLIMWRIPEPVCETALRHHEAKIPTSMVLLSRVQAGDAIADYLRMTPEEREKHPVAENPVVERLNLTELEIADLIVEIEDQMVVLRQLG